MTEFVVLHNVGGRQVTIALKGYEPTDGSVEVGTFEMDVDPLNAQTGPHALAGGQHEHPYIAKAKEILANSDDFHGEVNSLTFLDKASNAPVHDENVGFTDDMTRTEDAQHPEFSSQAGGEGSAAGTDPRSTDANGTEPKQERQDGGDTPAGGEDAQDEGADAEDDDGSETIAQLKERLATVTDKTALEADYKAEQEGKNRAGAIAAYEARAKELDEGNEQA